MDSAHARAIQATFQRDSSTKFSWLPTLTAPTIKTKAVLRDLILADWGPAMRGIAWAVGHAVVIPAAVLIVLTQWLAFARRRPLAGLLALVPVRKSMAFATTPKPVVDLKTQAYSQLQEEELGRVAAGFGLTPDELLRPIEFAYSYSNLADAALKLASISPRSDESSPQSEPVAPQVTEISPALDAALDQAIGLKRPVRPVGPDGPVLAPAPRRQRRGSKRPQKPA